MVKSLLVFHGAFERLTKHESEINLVTLLVMSGQISADTP